MKPFALILFTLLIAFATHSALAAEYEEADYGPLLKALGSAKVSLADGIRQESMSPETPISAKFEVEDGEFSLSVYTAAHGLGKDAEHNVLKEYAGDPKAKPWKPEAETFSDVEHVSRASTQLTMMAMSKLSLLDYVKKAEHDQPGQVFSVIPEQEMRKSFVEVLVAKGGKVVSLHYNVLTGKLMKKETL